MKKGQKGFTLMEMLIVVAIIAILIAIAIPTFTKQLNKAANAVDLANARNVYGALAAMFVDGTIDFPDSNSKGNGVWVLVTKEGKYPKDYGFMKGTMYCGSDAGVKVNGDASASWSAGNNALERMIKSQCGELKVKSFGGKTGWDWYVVQINYDGKTQQIDAVIYSGFAGESSQITSSTIQNGQSNMQKIFHIG